MLDSNRESYRITRFFCKFANFGICACTFCDFTPWQSDFYALENIVVLMQISNLICRRGSVVVLHADTRFSSAKWHQHWFLIVLTGCTTLLPVIFKRFGKKYKGFWTCMSKLLKSIKTKNHKLNEHTLLWICNKVCKGWSTLTWIQRVFFFTTNHFEISWDFAVYGIDHSWNCFPGLNRFEEGNPGVQ